MGLGDVVSSGQGAVVILGDGGAVTWRWMGTGDMATSGQGGPLTSCGTTPTLGPLGVRDGLIDGGEVRRGGGGEQERCDV